MRAWRFKGRKRTERDAEDRGSTERSQEERAEADEESSSVSGGAIRRDFTPRIH